MNNIKEAKYITSILNIPIVQLCGPKHLLLKWLKDPDLITKIPGISVSKNNSKQNVLYKVYFKYNNKRKIYWQNNKTIIFQGDIESLLSIDIRYLIIHISKSVIILYGYNMVHSSCLINSSGKGLLLVGTSGSGKSTIALSLAQAGYTILATDITLINSSIQAITGTKYISIYPGIIKKNFPKYCSLISREMINTNKYDFLKKIILPGIKLEESGYFSQNNTPFQIENVIKISLSNKDSLPHCYSMDNHEKLNFSIILNEDWATSIWIIPSWKMFFPIIDNSKTDKIKKNTALNLMKIPHYFLTGNLDYCLKKIKSLSYHG